MKPKGAVVFIIVCHPVLNLFSIPFFMVWWIDLKLVSLNNEKLQISFEFNLDFSANDKENNFIKMTQFLYSMGSSFKKSFSQNLFSFKNDK